jgi:hypothetical protein
LLVPVLIWPVLSQLESDLISAGQQANVGAQQIGQTAFEQSQFKPFSVTSGTGSISTSPTGGTTTTLAPQQQQLQQSLFGQQNAMAGYLGGFNPNQFSNLANMGYGGAQGFAGQAQQLDPYMQQQRTLHSTALRLAFRVFSRSPMLGNSLVIFPVPLGNKLRIFWDSPRHHNN